MDDDKDPYTRDLEPVRVQNCATVEELQQYNPTEEYKRHPEVTCLDKNLKLCMMSYHYWLEDTQDAKVI